MNSVPMPPEDQDPPPVPLWRQTMSEQREEGFGGLLLLVVIGRVLAPFLIALGLYKVVAVVLQPGVWAALTTPGSPAFHPFWGGLLIYEMVGYGSLFLTSLLLIWLLFRRQRAFPMTIIAYQAAFIVFQWGEVVIGSAIPTMRNGGGTGGLVFAALVTTVSGALWIWYFLASERVRNTFTR